MDVKGERVRPVLAPGPEAGQESTAAVEDMSAWRQRLLRGVLRAMVVVGVPAVALGSYSAYETNDLWLIPIYLAIYGIILLVAFWRRVSYAAQAWTLLSLMYGWGVLEFLDSGLSGEGRTVLLILPILAALLFGLRESVAALILAPLTITVFGWAYSSGQLPVSPDPRVLATSLTWWLNAVIIYVLLSITMVISQNYLVPRLVNALSRSRRLALELHNERAGLEERVQERTLDLARRNTQMEAAAQVAREAAAIHDLGNLLQETARLISDRFGFYHVGMFLLDASGEWATLQAASSAGGQRMLARGHRLKVGEVGIVGYVTGRGEPRVALDVGTDAVFFDNPDLPDTRSEMALPLRARGEVIGALDVQSTQPAAFSEDSIAVLQMLADQLALAISNARLFQQAQGALEAERRAYGELSRQAWSELLRARPGLGERYDPQGILPTAGQWRQDMKLAAHKGQTVVAGADGGTSAYTRSQNGSTIALATPIKVRDLVIGVLDAHKALTPGPSPKVGRGGERGSGGAGETRSRGAGERGGQGAGERGWTAEEITLLETLADQLGVALENARLYQDTQRRAVRERLTGEVTTRMRETLDVDTVLQTAVREIGEALGLHDVTIRLDTDTDEGNTDGQE